VTGRKGRRKTLIVGWSRKGPNMARFRESHSQGAGPNVAPGEMPTGTPQLVREGWGEYLSRGELIKVHGTSACARVVTKILRDN